MTTNQTQFLHPMSVRLPSQGGYKFEPAFRVYEDTTAAGLQAQLSGQANIDAQDPSNLWVVEEIEFQTTFAPTPMDQDRVLYSCMVWLTKVIIL